MGVEYVVNDALKLNKNYTLTIFIPCKNSLLFNLNHISFTILRLAPFVSSTHISFTPKVLLFKYFIPYILRLFMLLTFPIISIEGGNKIHYILIKYYFIC